MANTEHISAQNWVWCSDLIRLLKDGTCYLTCSTVVTLGEFPGQRRLSWGDTALCGSTKQGCMPLQASAVQTCPDLALLHRSLNQSSAAATSGPTVRHSPAAQAIWLLPAARNVTAPCQCDGSWALHEVQDVPMFTCQNVTLGWLFPSKHKITPDLIHMKHSSGKARPPFKTALLPHWSQPPLQ